MSQSNWAAFWVKLGVSATPSKRIPQLRKFWGSEAEHLENRALLSAVTLQADPTAHSEVASRKKVAQPYPTIVGTWNVTASGTVGNTSGTAVITVTQSKPNKPPTVSSVITLLGLPVINGNGGKFETNNHHIVSSKTKIPIPGFGTPTASLTITFEAGSNPTTFTGTVIVAGRELARITGTKQVPTTV